MNYFAIMLFSWNVIVMFIYGIDKLLAKSHKNRISEATLIVCALFGFSPAIFSGITFIRMYMMLTFVCLFILYVHIRAILKEQLSFSRFYLPVMLLSFVGFQIHYYFAVFLFFMAAAVSSGLACWIAYAKRWKRKA